MVQSKFHPFLGSLKSHPDPPLAERQTRPPADPLPFEGDFGPLLFIWIVLTAEVCGDARPAPAVLVDELDTSQFKSPQGRTSVGRYHNVRL